MSKKKYGLALGIVVAMLFASLASADDITPPPWRGQPGTTLTKWEFLTSDPNPAPDFEFNPYGSSSTSVYPGVGQNWWSSWGGRDGVWPLSGTIEILIPNRPVTDVYKEIWIQLTWAAQAPGTEPYVWETISGNEANLVSQTSLGPTGEPAPADGDWYHSVYQIYIYPNPFEEIVRIDGAVMVDELVIDTICAPEPVTLVLLAGGVLAALARRR